MRRWVDNKKVAFIFWSGATVSVVAFTLWILSFEGALAFAGNSNWLGALGPIALLIAYLWDTWLSQKDGGTNSRLFVICALILLGGSAWMLLTYRINEIYYFPDTWEYLSVARFPIFSEEFFQSLRAPTLPLLLKLFGFSSFHGPTPEFLASAKLFTQFQSLLSFGASAILGLTVAWSVKYRPVKPVALLVVMAFGLNTHISMWNKIVYAESVSASLFFLLIASLLILHRIMLTRKDFHPVMWFSSLLVFGVISVAFALTRDSNAYLILFIAITQILEKAYTFLVRKSLNGKAVVLPAVLLAAFVLSSVSAQGGQRWLRPNLNVIHQRILPNEDSLGFYIERGLPYYSNKSIFNMEWEEFGPAVNLSSEGDDILTWVRDHGQSTYYSFLLANPVQSLLLPLINADHLLLPDSREYQLIANSPPDWVSVVDTIVFPTSPEYLGVWAIVILLGTVYWCAAKGWDDRFSIAVFLLIAIYPMMFVIYHGDEMEIERHALGLAIHLRLALFILSLVLIDNFLRRSNSSAAPQSWI